MYSVCIISQAIESIWESYTCTYIDGWQPHPEVWFIYVLAMGNNWIKVNKSFDLYVHIACTHNVMHTLHKYTGIAKDGDSGICRGGQDCVGRVGLTKSVL